MVDECRIGKNNMYLRLKRFDEPGNDPDLPLAGLALFRRVRNVKRGDVVLLNHPEYGILVRRVFAVSVGGRISVRSLRFSEDGPRDLIDVGRRRILGKMLLRMNWARFFPYFGKTRDYIATRIEGDETRCVSPEQIPTQSPVKEREVTHSCHAV